MTANQFIISACVVFPELPVAKVAECFYLTSLPHKTVLLSVAQAQQDGLTPHESTLARHTRLEEIIQWAKA